MSVLQSMGIWDTTPGLQQQDNQLLSHRVHVLYRPPSVDLEP